MTSAKRPSAQKRAPKQHQNAKPINLALQGGGAHGAFTWGVLDRLLEDDRIYIEAFTGTSAGAMNAAVAAYGLIEGGRMRARELLHEFWQKVSTVASMSPLQPSPIEKLWGQNDMSYSPSFMAMDFFTRMFSPYQYNIFDLNPLRDIVNELVDFEKIRANKEVCLFINATNVRTGKVKVFRTREMTLDKVMASACLPFMFKAVEIDGESYWDGGYTGNPALFPLFYEATSSDIVVVQINPLHIQNVPTQASEILDRVNEISFNASLIQEMRAISFVKKLLAGQRVPDNRYKDVHIHLIEAEAVMHEAGATSKFNADWDFLRYLHSVGYQAASDWLEANFDAIGEDSTIDVEALYL